MPDKEKVEKVVKALECCSSCDSFDKTCMKCPYNIHCQEGDTWAIKQDALALLKEQQNQIWEMQDRTEYLEDKLNEQPQIVRCKDCIKRDSWACWQYFSGRLTIPGDWFCADGERRTDDG